MKNNRFLRVVALVLTVVVCFGLFSAAAFAEEGEAVNLMRAPKKLEEMYPSEGQELPFWGQLSIPRYWITSVEFHDTKEGAPANILDFSANCDKSVIGWYDQGAIHVAADGKITLGETAAWMFAYFTNVKTIRFNGAVDTSRVKNMENMFMYCSNLESVDVEGFDTANVTSMRNMFAYCEKLNSVDVSTFNTENVKDFSFMFFFCRQVPALNVANFNTSNAQYAMSMFYRCEHLKDLDTSNFDTSKMISDIHMTDFVGIK